ncbi:hypothetical protein AHF37_09060 [Paragonimus kellicotti]|nr:hypothetical protein AHF37_09060 [Paragonimus kellicotti]
MVALVFGLLSSIAYCLIEPPAAKKSFSFLFVQVCIYDTDKFQLVTSFRPASSANAAVKSIEFSRRGECFLLNCADRIIRVFSCEEVLQADGAELEPNKKLKDLVTL